jgi:hypothetical protein
MVCVHVQVNDFEHVGDAKTIGQSYPKLSEVLEVPSGPRAACLHQQAALTPCPLLVVWLALGPAAVQGCLHSSSPAAPTMTQ